MTTASTRFRFRSRWKQTSPLVMAGLLVLTVTGCSPQSPAGQDASTNQAVANSPSGSGNQSDTTSGSSDASNTTVPFTPLKNGTTQVDVAELQKLDKAHPGDGITRGPNHLVYNIGLRIFPDKHAFEARESLHLSNNLQTPLQKLYFNVWPDSLTYQKQGSKETVGHVVVNGSPAAFSLKGTVLTVTPSKPIPKGASATVEMDVSAILPHNQDRYGWDDTGINLGNWYPILAVHDDHGWVTPPYYSQGESFYSLVGDYHLTIQTPKNLTIAVTGDQASKQSNANGTVTTTYVAKNVRDVALDANTAYKVLQQKVGNVTVSTYYTNAQAAEAQWMEQSGVRALKTYIQWYGAYPYHNLQLCAMHGWFGGMEYPELDMVTTPHA